MAYYAPIGLLLLPVTWVAMVLLGYTRSSGGPGSSPLSEAFAVSGSSLFTLGFDRPAASATSCSSFIEALARPRHRGAHDLLPAVDLRRVQPARDAGRHARGPRRPPAVSPAELLVRYARIGWLDSIDEELFAHWETWFADIEESHTSQPALDLLPVAPSRAELDHGRRVRARHRGDLGTRRSTKPHDARADLLIRSGLPLPAPHRRLLRHRLRPRPPPGRPDLGHPARVRPRCASSSRRPGCRSKADRDQAWRDFAGWRVNYDTVLIALCALVMAPPRCGRATGSTAPAAGATARRASHVPRRRATARAARGQVACAAAQSDDQRSRPRRARNGTTRSHRGAGPRCGRIRTRPQRKPPTRPPRWPPIEMPGMAKVSTRLMISSPPRLRPHDRDLADHHAGHGAAHEAEGHARRARGDGARVVGERAARRPSRR